jgi:hypothetical protein
VNAIATHTVSFTTADPLPADGKIVVTFAAGFDLSAVKDADVSSGTMDGSFTVNTIGQELTITRSGGTDQSASAESIIIADIINTGTAGASYTVTVETRDSISTPINGPTVSSTFAIFAAATISSAANQIFTKGDLLTAISTITIADTVLAATITTANDIRIRIPDNFNMVWDTADITATIGGGAFGKVDSAVSYEDNGKTLVLNVTSDFTASDQITVSDLGFTGFTAQSFADNLELEVYNDDLVTDTDDKHIRIADPDEADKDLNPVENLVYIPAGSFVIPMDNTLQSLVSPFNLKAYGLVNALLWNEIPLNWAIKTGKAKDGIDFSLRAKQIYPSEILPAAYVDFKAGPFIIPSSYADAAKPIIEAFGNQVVVYEITEVDPDESVDVRYTLNQQPKIGVLDDGGKADIHSTILDQAGFVAGQHYDVILAATLLTINADSCYTVVTEPHFDPGGRNTDPQANAVRSFLDSGGNFLAQCHAILTYENNTAYGYFQTSSGVVGSDTGDTDLLYANPDLSYSQFEDDIDGSQGGSVEDYTFDTGSSFQNDGHSHVSNDPETDVFIATASKITNGAGSNVYYLGGHDYKGNTIEQYNGKRMYLNAVMTPSARPAICESIFATAVDLIGFNAMGRDSTVQVFWQTGRESDNKGFHLYRSTNLQGPFEQLTDKLIPGAGFMANGRSYDFSDVEVTDGQIYYYRLEDIDIDGKKTRHGPVCVDWDGDSLPDDWELAFGLDRARNNTDLDPDADGLTNLQEYLRGSDPFNPDSDGDGILDGQEALKLASREAGGTRLMGRGIEVLSEDETGVILELRTKGFETEVVTVNGRVFERLRINEYIHGFTSEIGRPQLPVKGILLNLPAGMAARVSVQQTEVQPHSGFMVYPVPQHAAAEQGDTAGLAEIFTIDDAFYEKNRFYPAEVARAGERYVWRDQAKHQILFYPLAFNPATGDLTLYTRIRIKVDYVDAELLEDNGPQPLAWHAPTQDSRFKTNPSLASMSMAFIGTPILTNAFASILPSIQMLLGSLWTPPIAKLSPETPAYKIMISQEGIYRLTGTDLTVAGVDLAAMDLDQIRLYHLGDEVAVYIYDLNGDDTLDSTDYIMFYGRTVDSDYAKYTESNVYWLTLSGGNGASQRISEIDGTPFGGQLATDFKNTTRHETDEMYVLTAPGGDAVDRWFFSTYVPGDGWDKGWVPTAGDPIPFTVPLPGAVGTGSVTIVMFGSFNQDHEVTVAINGTGYGTYTWSGVTYHQVTIENVPLIDGDNTVSLTCSSGEDTILLDWIEVSHSRNFSAAGDSLKFSPDAGSRFRVSNLSGNGFMVFDITDAANVGHVTGFTIAGSGPYSLEFEPDTSAGAAHSYLVLTDAALMTPDSITADAAGNLGDVDNGADYILITHRDLGWDGNGDEYPWLNNLAALRQAQGLRVRVVDVADIFDEFSYGHTTPQALRNFLAYAYENWTAPAPQYVLLVGDHTYDYKNNNGGGSENFVPTWLAYTSIMGETVTDEYFARISGGDAVPDLYIGRLPATSHTEAAVMTQKIIDYEQALNTKTWQKDTLLVADNQTENYERVFEVINDYAADLLPSAMNTPNKAYLNDYVVARDLTTDIKGGFDNGALIINFSGHGGFNLWATERIFDTSNAWPNFYHDVADLAPLTEENKGRYPFVVSMSCLTGYFGGLGFWENPSLMETLLRTENKGAAAALMPTGKTATSGQHILISALFESIFTEDIRRLGPAISAAKQTLLANGNHDYEQVSETFLLFGDPAMTLKIPLPTRPKDLQALQKLDGRVLLSWLAASDCNGSPATGYNIYRSTGPGEAYIKLNAMPVADTEYVDQSLSGGYSKAAVSIPGTTYYYAITAVDPDGDESPLSQELSPTPETVIEEAGTPKTNSAGIETSGGGGSGGCFIATVERTEAAFFLTEWPTSSVFGLLALIGLLWLGKKRRG